VHLASLPWLRAAIQPSDHPPKSAFAPCRCGLSTSQQLDASTNAAWSHLKSWRAVQSSARTTEVLNAPPSLAPTRASLFARKESRSRKRLYKRGIAREIDRKYPKNPKILPYLASYKSYYVNLEKERKNRTCWLWQIATLPACAPGPYCFFSAFFDEFCCEISY
jgi:hypothetical protein